MCVSDHIILANRVILCPSEHSEGWWERREEKRRGKQDLTQTFHILLKSFIAKEQNSEDINMKKYNISLLFVKYTNICSSIIQLYSEYETVFLRNHSVMERILRLQKLQLTNWIN